MSKPADNDRHPMKSESIAGIFISGMPIIGATMVMIVMTIVPEIPAPTALGRFGLFIEEPPW
jgi:hypothetical protein